MADRAQVQGIGDVGAPGEFLRCALEKIVFFESRVSLKIARDVLDALSTHYAQYKLESVVRQRRKLAQASSEGCGILGLAPGRHRHRGRAAGDPRANPQGGGACR